MVPRLMSGLSLLRWYDGIGWLYAEIAPTKPKPRDSRQRVELTLAENMFISINNIYKLAGGYEQQSSNNTKTEKRTKPAIKIIFAI